MLTGKPNQMIKNVRIESQQEVNPATYSIFNWKVLTLKDIHKMVERKDGNLTEFIENMKSQPGKCMWSLLFSPFHYYREKILHQKSINFLCGNYVTEIIYQLYSTECNLLV